MTRYLSGAAVLAEARLRSDALGSGFGILIVEGGDDVRALGRCCANLDLIIPAGGKPTVLEAADQVHRDESDRYLFMVDCDYDVPAGTLTGRENLLITTHPDLEVDMIAAGVARDLVLQLVPRASNSEGDLRRITDAVLGHATALAEAAGRLRHLSTVESLELSFERLKLRKYRDKTSRCVDAARIARAVVMNSGSDESAGELAQRASEVGGGLSVCNGHDLVESIRTVLHQDFGVPYNRLESLDDLLRSNITRDALARWPGLARVRHWERTTRRKVLNV